MQIYPNRKSLHGPLRIIVVLLLYVAFFSPIISPREGNSYGFKTALNGFLMVFIPTVAIVILIPVLIRGTLGEKIVAVILLLPPAWFVFWMWYGVVSDFLNK
ncbi:MAG TPA: hypothetical protein VIK59_02340 [Verrucomicrobiae bacterium]